MNNRMSALPKTRIFCCALPKAIFLLFILIYSVTLLLALDTYVSRSQYIQDGKPTYYDGGYTPMLISGESPAYPRHLLRMNISGNVVLDIEIISDGSVGTVEVVKSLMDGPGGFDESAINAVKQWKFPPIKGKPDTCWIRQTFHFDYTNSVDGEYINAYPTIINPPIQRELGKTSKFTVYEDPPVIIAGRNVQQTILPEQKQAGQVIVEIEIFEDGSVGAIEVVKSLDDEPGGIDEQVINTVKEWKFQSAKNAGSPVACWIR